MRWAPRALEGDVLAAYREPGTYRATVWAVDGRGRTGFKVVSVAVG